MPEKPAPMITISWSIRVTPWSVTHGGLAVDRARAQIPVGVEEVGAVGHERRRPLDVLEHRLGQAPVEVARGVLAAADVHADLAVGGHDRPGWEDVAGLPVARVAAQRGLADEPAGERDRPQPVVVDIDP